MLYAIQASMLSLQLEQARNDHELISIRMACGTRDINRTRFADHTIMLGGIIHNIMRRFKAELDSYFQASASKLNLRKSKFYSWNVNTREIFGISRTLGSEGVTTWDSFKYLGIPIFNGKPKTSG